MTWETQQLAGLADNPDEFKPRNRSMLNPLEQEEQEVLAGSVATEIDSRPWFEWMHFVAKKNNFSFTSCYVIIVSAGWRIAPNWSLRLAIITETLR